VPSRPPEQRQAGQRAFVVIEVFEHAESPQLYAWLALRRRILSGATRARTGALGLRKGREHLHGTSIFTVFAGNGRAIASSAEVFGDPASAEAGAAALMMRQDGLELLPVVGTPAPAHAWLIRADGAPKLMPLRYYSTRRARDANAAAALAAVSSGFLVPLGDTSPHGRRSRERLSAHDAPIEGTTAAEPLKERGEPRPIRPIASRDAVYRRVKVRRARDS
jgi:hypothetical protein